MSHWYALYTKPGKEGQVDGLLRQRGTETYFPTVRRRVRRRDRPDRMALFPCYLFARLDFDETPRSSVAWMPGIRRIVSNGQAPAIVPDELVEFIKERIEGLDESGYDEFKPGDRVRITAGPLRDLDAVFDRSYSSAERVRVLLNVMGRVTPAVIERLHIARA